MAKFVELTQASRGRKHLPGAAVVDMCFGFTGESGNSFLNLLLPHDLNSLFLSQWGQGRILGMMGYYFVDFTGRRLHVWQLLVFFFFFFFPGFFVVYVFFFNKLRNKCK